MIVKTKKYQLKNEQFIKLGVTNIAKDLWWAWLIPVSIMLIPIFWNEALYWCIGIALTLLILYVIFWVIQFVGITQHEQGKMFLQRLSYQIDSRQILIKLNEKQGMPLGWEQIKVVRKTKQGYIFKLSLIQFIYLPFTIFRNENDIRFLDALLKRKNLIKPDKKVDQNQTQNIKKK